MVIQACFQLRMCRKGIEIEDVFDSDMEIIIVILEELFELEVTENDDSITLL